MKKLIHAKLAGYILLILFGALLVFHVLILFNLLPSGMVWGGQAGNYSLRTLEIVSLAFTFLFSLVVAAKIGYIKAGKFAKVI
ncbi:MAG: hypothetical protein NZV61_08500, partial [Candidatus Bipolaricaulota bacterium]|nr:hypothetical protein [Candidatus Bipolaricaulota bacterium]